MPTYDAGFRDGFAAGVAFARTDLTLRSPSELDRVAQRQSRRPAKTPRRGKAAPGLGKAMKEANKRLRTKSGKLRKGKTQADVARLAHKIRRRNYK